MINYEFTFLYFARFTCANDLNNYTYIDYQSQLCYTECPNKTFPIDVYCYSCFDCPDILMCEECYDHGCDSGYFFTTTTMRFSCIPCSSAVSNCYKCLANITNTICE